MARWATRSGLNYEYMFEGPVSEEGARGRMIANLCTMGVHRPDMYRLERVSPRLEDMKWNYPMLVASNKTLTR